MALFKQENLIPPGSYAVDLHKLWAEYATLSMDIENDFHSPQYRLKFLAIMHQPRSFL